jgi:hypothetical protein
MVILLSAMFVASTIFLQKIDKANLKFGKTGETE